MNIFIGFQYYKWGNAPTDREAANAAAVTLLRRERLRNRVAALLTMT